MEAEQMLRALGEPMRYRIYELLLCRKHCVRSLSKKLGITESAVSQHLRVMREAGLIYREKFGYHTHYLPRQEAIDLLTDRFLKMQMESRALDRTSNDCQCDFKKEAEQ